MCDYPPLLAQLKVDKRMDDDILTCPVCLEIDTPSYQCRNGHIVCGGCLDRLTVQPERFRCCPTCRVAYGRDRLRLRQRRLDTDTAASTRNTKRVSAAASGPNTGVGGTGRSAAPNESGAGGRGLNASMGDRMCPRVDETSGEIFAQIFRP